MIKEGKCLPGVLILFTLLMLSLLCPLLLGGCSNPSWAAAGEIIPPAHQECPLEGKWTVLRNLDTNGQTQGNQLFGVGDSAQFTSKGAVFGDDVWDTPSYKIKKVNSADYLMTKYISLAGTDIPEDQEVEVITVYTASNFLGEFLIIDDRQMISFVQNKALLLQKVSDQTDISIPSGEATVTDRNTNVKAGASGVLLGLKIPYDGGFTYRTLWIAADSKKLHPILTGEDIFFPRNSGFWKLEVNDAPDQVQAEEVLSARDVANKVFTEATTKAPEEAAATRISGTGHITAYVINYIGNDYIAVEEESAGITQLRVLPVDKISSPNGIKVSDLLGAKGLSVYKSAREQALGALGEKEIIVTDQATVEENFGLSRKNGHWYLQGRINYRSGGAPAHTEFNINVIPPGNLIFYDTLGLSWRNIKDRIPDAMDAFTSPNKDIAIIKTKTKLYIFAMTHEQLGSKPLAEIATAEGESVIMAEWATGSYVDNWEKAFRANGAEAWRYSKTTKK